MTRIFIGVAWPYANGPFHIGHLAGAYLPGDTFARYHRLRGNEVLMVSGSDMHGTPIALRADQEGTTAQAVAERFDAVHRACFQRLGFSFDCYTNTHTLLHERTVQELFLALFEKRLLVRRTEAAAYCPKDARFLPDRYLRGICPHCGNPDARGDECDRCGRVLEPSELLQPVCRICGTSAEFRQSEHFYLALEKLEPKVREFLGSHPGWRPNVRGVAENFLAKGLHPTPITRDLDWGIPLPLDGYEGKRIYVWFEAVIGYLSASKEWAIRAGTPEAWRRFWEPSADLRSYYFIGKDNIFHHTILWPAIGIGVGGLALASDVPANEWLTVGGGKISKSRPEDADAFLPTLLDRYAPDEIRFYAAALAPQNHDTDYDPAEFRQLTQEVLSNQYGNLAQRLLVLTRERHQGATPPVYPTDLSTGAFAERLRSAHARIGEEYGRVHLKEALELALGEIREGNRRFHEAKPWQAADAERDRAIAETLWLLKAAAIWLAPVLPFSSVELYRMLGFPDGPGPGSWDDALTPPPAGHRLGPIRPLFPRRDTVTASRPPAAAVAAPVVGGPVPLEIRAAQIRTVEPHPSADRLYAMTVDAGEAEPRSVVAGLRSSYTPEELRGRRILLLANLEARSIRKVLSDGMVLAADAGERAVLLEPPTDVAVGTPIEGVERGARRIRYDEFETAPMTVGTVRSSGPASEIEVGGRSVTVPGRWEAGRTVVVRLEGPGADRGTVLGFSGERPASVVGPVAIGSRVK